MNLQIMKKFLLLKILEQTALFSKEGKERLVAVEDAWYDPIRELSK